MSRPFAGLELIDQRAPADERAESIATHRCAG